MTTDSELERRLDAVERRLTDGRRGEAEAESTAGLDDLPDRAGLDERLRDVESRLDAMAERLDELDAANQAVRGYVGGVRAVNRDVERRADAALAAVDRLERAMDGSDALGGVDGIGDDVDAGGGVDGSRDGSDGAGGVGSDRERHAGDGAGSERRGDDGSDDRARSDDPDDSLAARLRDAL